MGILFYWCLPNPLFKDPYSSVLNDRQGRLMGAKIALDGQWRFPEIREVPINFQQAILTFEDKRFFSHLGVDFLSLGRAMVQNVKAGKVVSGASTLSMQVIRLSRKGKPRSIPQKLIEMVLALRMECSFSKLEIMKMYASHAPFGGNVVGLEAASWRYYKKPPKYLSIAEAAMLAVLPNAPSLIHLSKNKGRLLKKRNKLLRKMFDQEIIDKNDYELSLLESIPEAPYPLPSIAPHLLEYVNIHHPQQIVNSTVHSELQKMSKDVANIHHQQNEQSDIHNLAILILETNSGEVVSYIGNAPNTQQESAVDMIQAKRSSGSVLKPLLYAHLIDEGKLMPKALLKDIPTQIQGFKPKNYNRKYSGAIPADEAIAKSLNIPAVRALQTYGVEPFINRLKDHGFTTINKSAEHYGLSLILGGAEVSLWELCGAYANLGKILRSYNKHQKYSNDHLYPHVLPSDEMNVLDNSPSLLSAGAIHETFQAMLNVIRPGIDGNWEQFQSSKPIAWKTGTSYGHRDAWAIGVTAKYTIGVWVGNANGEGKSGLVGVKKAGPILFDVLNRLEVGPFFNEPIDDLIPVATCRKSGFLASQYCEGIDTLFAPMRSQENAPCPYHKRVHLDNNGFQVTSICLSPSQMTHQNWFELPPSMAYYYRKSHPDYRPIPQFNSACLKDSEEGVMSFLYPSEKAKIYLPINIKGEKEKAIFKASHQNPNANLYWHLNDEYLGYTSEFHSMEIAIEAGNHRVTIVDQDGNRIRQAFEVVN